jgi:hypothetical protein
VGVTVDAPFVWVVAYHGVGESIHAVVDRGLFEFWTKEQVALAHVLSVGARLGSRAFANTGGFALAATHAGCVPCNAAGLWIA